MAARVAPGETQRLRHFVSTSPSDAAMPRLGDRRLLED
jgi:hypothetical protein